MPVLISAPVLAAVLWALCLALGYRAVRLLKVPLDAFSMWERGVICCAVGAGLLQYEPYLLGVFGELSARNALLGFGLLYVVLIPDLVHVARAILRSLRGLRHRSWSPPRQLWLLLFVLLMSILLLDTLTLNAFGSDDDGYHLSAPKRWLADGFLSYLPTYTNTNASAGFEMLYVLGLASGNAGLKIIHFSAGVFSLLTLWLCARRIGSGHAGILAISLLMIATLICNVPVLFGLAFVDFGACWMTLISVLVWLTWREQRAVSAARLLILMALAAGFAASFKSTALTVAVAWSPVLIWEARHRGLEWNKIATAGLGLGFVAFLPVSPWLFRSWNLTGNPLFPMLSSLIPTRDWDAEMAAVFSKYAHYYSWAVERHMSEVTRKAIVGTIAALVLLAGGIIVVRARDPVIRALIGFAASLVLMTIAALGLYFRYWLPAEMCVALVVATLFVQRFPTSAVTRWLPCALLVVALAVTLRMEHYKPGIHLLAELRVATGFTTLDQEYASEPPWNMWHYIDDHTSSDTRVLVGAFYTSFGASNYGCFWLKVRCFTTDSYIQSFIKLSDWQSFTRSLNQAGIHYLLISDQRYSPNRIGFSFAAGDNEYPFCRRLADQYGKKLAQFGPLQFYSFNLPP